MESEKRLSFKNWLFSKFDTINVYCKEAKDIHLLAQERGFNFLILPKYSSVEDSQGFGISLDELSTDEEINLLVNIFADVKNKDISKINTFLTSNSSSSVYIYGLPIYCR